MARSFRIGSRIIDDSSRPYLIAEIGHSHQGNIETCKAMFKAAKDAGADAVKLQKRDNRRLYTKAAYNAPYTSPHAFGATYGEHREFLEFGASQYAELQDFAYAIGIDFFATAFDPESADLLVGQLDMPAIKVASGDITNTPFLGFLAELGIPLVVSTGTADQADVDAAVKALAGSEFALLQCTAEYPAVPERLNLRVIETFRERYPETVIGLSSHLPYIWDVLPAYNLGARIIEKHFTLDRGWKGSDHAMSLTPDRFLDMRKDLANGLHDSHMVYGDPCMGDGIKRRYPQEAGAITKMGKVCYTARALPAGHILTAADIIIRSPGGVGLTPRYLDDLIGLELQVPMAEEEPFTAENVAAQ